MREWRVVLAALVIFGAGVITGGLTVRLARNVSFRQPLIPPASQEFSPLPGPRPGAPKNNLLARHEAQIRDLVRRMDQRLDLTPHQRARIEELVTETQRRMRQMFNDLTPRTRDEIRELHHRIRLELTPEQRRDYDRLTRSGGLPEGGGALPPRTPQEHVGAVPDIERPSVPSRE